MDISQSQIVSFIWGIADDCLRDVFVRGQYRDVILPMVVLRRFDALLEPTKEQVEQEIADQREIGLTDDDFDEGALCDITRLSFYNTSRWTLNRIKSQATDDNNLLYQNFVEYLNGYSENVKDVLRNFDYYNKAKRLADNDRLLAVIEKITDAHINLTDRPATDPDGLPLPAISNVAMGTIFEELLRKFNEENNEEAGEHFTPRDAIGLLARLVFEPVKDNLPKTISLYDPACGSGGMLTEGREFLIENLGVSPSAIQLFGTEINPETYAICKADLIIKGVNPEGMFQGNTIVDNNFASKSFGYMLTNPPYGKSWKTDKTRIYHDKALLDTRFELPLTDYQGNLARLDCTPRTSDGQLLFILEEIDKMKPLRFQPQGSRIASIHNGSSLFTGDAGSGESNIRRYLIENDFVDAIIQLPNNIFYNTGISTYVWLMTNKKEERRKGKVQLIDASHAFDKLRKNQGSRNCTITPEYAEMIVQAYMSFAPREATKDNPIVSKIFDGDDFRYYSVTIERPLRLRSRMTMPKCDELLFDSKKADLSKWLYNTYGELCFDGLQNKVAEIKEYLNDEDIKLTDKQLEALIATKKWEERRQLMTIATELLHIVGTDEFTDYNIFFARLQEATKAVGAKLGIKISDAQIKNIARAMSESDPSAQPVIKKKDKKSGSITYEPDTDLRDTEKIAVAEDIQAYFDREVKPYVPDAWIDWENIAIGCEISFNKYFYKPVALRTLQENEADIIALDKESDGFIKELLSIAGK